MMLAMMHSSRIVSKLDFFFFRASFYAFTHMDVSFSRSSGENLTYMFVAQRIAYLWAGVGYEFISAKGWMVLV